VPKVNSYDTFNQSISEIKSLDNNYNDVDSNYENEIHKPGYTVNVDVCGNLLSFTEFIGSKENLNVEIQVHNNDSCIRQFESKDIVEVKSLENICNDNDHSYESETHNPVYPNNKVKITSSLFYTEEFNNSLTNINDKLSSINNNKKPMLLYHTINLKDELLNGIHRHGIQNLMPLQQQCMFHYINGRDVIFHSYPCVGKSTVCLISVLQRINTSLNECQAIILVPTLDLALSAQKVFSLILRPLTVLLFLIYHVLDNEINWEIFKCFYMYWWYQCSS